MKLKSVFVDRRGSAPGNRDQREWEAAAENILCSSSLHEAMFGNSK